MSPEEFATKSFDYVIIGGGTAGLTLAARLSEDENVTVAVLEAGGDRLNDPMVNTPGLSIQLMDKPEYDWSFQTVPQKQTRNRIHGWTRGKCLGGSSAVNFMMFSHCSKQDLDNWIELGNKGWGWDDMVPYFRKFETYNPPSEATGKKFNHIYIDPLLRGTEGPLQISFSESDLNWVQEAWPKTCKNLGYPEPKDPRVGSAVGGFNQLTTVDPKAVTRSYSASAFYAPNKNRKNLSVLTDALVSKINFNKNGSTGEVSAAGVNFIAGERNYSVKTNKEVIICAGVIQSPQILELSGVGSKELLQKYNIDVVIDNPAVGENLQDHTATPFSWEAADGVKTKELFHNPDIVKQAMEAYVAFKAGPMANSLTATGFVPYHTMVPSSSISDVSAHINAICPSTPDTRDAILKRQLMDPREAAIQLVPIAGGSDTSKCDRCSGTYAHDWPGAYCSLAVCTTRPFSRGSIHIKSASPTEHPIIDPAYLTHPLDVDVAAQAILHAQELVKTEPFASHLKSDENGNKIAQPSMFIPKTLEEAKEHVHNHTVTEYHPIGTCTMLPKESGGVVGSNLKVYGTSNVRVCDASVFPLHVQGNIQSLVYAVAERTADLIKGKI